MSRRDHDSTGQERTINLKPKTQNQEDYIRCLVENDVVFCSGPAGTGKSHLAIGLACQYLQEGKVDKILVARPAVEASGKKGGLGALKGYLWDKIEPYMQPAVEHFEQFLGETKLQALKEKEVIQFEPLEFLRGRNYHQTFMILDESQSATLDQLIMFVSRMGRRSKVAVLGDPHQTDIPKAGEYGTDLEYMVDKVIKAELPNFGACQLTHADIIRNPILAPFLQLFGR